jgi:hypothetical protein
MAPAGFAADKGEAQEVKALRLAKPALSTPSRRMAARPADPWQLPLERVSGKTLDKGIRRCLYLGCAAFCKGPQNSLAAVQPERRHSQPTGEVLYKTTKPLHAVTFRLRAPSGLRAQVGRELGVR